MVNDHFRAYVVVVVPPHPHIASYVLKVASQIKRLTLSAPQIKAA